MKYFEYNNNLFKQRNKFSFDVLVIKISSEEDIFNIHLSRCLWTGMSRFLFYKRDKIELFQLYLSIDSNDQGIKWQLRMSSF